MNPPPAPQRQRQGVLAVGNWIIDHVKLVDVWPAQEELATITGQSEGNGGGPYNLLKNLAKLQCGFPLAGVGLIGCDADGESILRDCDAHGIERGNLQQTAAAPTSYTDVVTVRQTGRRTFFHQPGTNALLELSHFDLSRTSARIFYLGYLCLLRRLDVLDRHGRTPASRLFEQARTLGQITVADLVSSPADDMAAIVSASLPHLDFLFLNEYELARLVNGSVGKSADQLEGQARTVLARGVRRAVIVHRPEIALCVPAEQAALIQPAVRLPLGMIAGMAGAGDAFAAGFILGLHESWDLQACLELGVCTAAASLRDATCSAAVGPWRECLEFGRSSGFLAEKSIR